jgi:phosphatidylserine/phosphatidylglycerophosphate/cardiolipin synthase-like enzyme
MFIIMALMLSKTVAFTLLGMIFTACSGTSGTSTSPITLNGPLTQAWAAVYFTDPSAPGAEFLRGGPDEPLQAAIENARASLDMAIYDLNLYNIRNALVDARGRGVQVRVVVDENNFEPGELAIFDRADIPVTVAGRSNSMHNKFLIIDRYEVWTGSMNFTLSEAYGNRNNLVRIRSFSLAENYLTEFEEMFTLHQFGPASPVNTPNQTFELDGRFIETFFSPEDNTLTRLVSLVNGAEEKITFMAFSFTSDDLAAAMVRALDRGVEVKGILDKSQGLSNRGGEYWNLLSNGVDVRLDGEDGSMHHKVLIIDERILVTGSYNFSASAERQNDENTLILHDEWIALQFMEEFLRLWELAE